MFLTGVPAIQRTNSAKPDARTEQDRQREYERFMAKLDGMQESEAQRARRRAREDKLADEKRAKARKSSELQGRIAQLRSKLSANPGDKTAAAELSAAQTQLYWLTNTL